MLASLSRPQMSVSTAEQTFSACTAPVNLNFFIRLHTTFCSSLTVLLSESFKMADEQKNKVSLIDLTEGPRTLSVVC